MGERGRERERVVFRVSNGQAPLRHKSVVVVVDEGEVVLVVVVVVAVLRQ